MENNKTYIGMWAKKDKNGNPFLSGSYEGLVYFIFRDKKDPSVKTLHTLKSGDSKAKLVKVGELETREGANGEYSVIGNMCLFKNERRTADNHPDFNLVVYTDSEGESEVVNG